MKKITFLFLLLGGVLFAQQPQAYTELTNQNQENQSNNESVTITSSQGIIDTYVALPLFENAVNDNCSDTSLQFENFLGGPIDITSCGVIISSDGDGCFNAGELEAGFDVQASNATEVVSIPPGAIGNVDALVGATTFAEYTIINFGPSVYAVAMDLWENNDPSTEVRIFGEGGALIETLTIDVPVNIQVFFGVIADEPITSIEIQGANDSGELFGNFYFGATCEALAINDNLLSEISIFPNPSSNSINITTPSSVEIISSKLYDVLGNVVLESDKSQMNISHLSTGLYLLNINTTSGSITKKVFRK